MNPIQGMFYFEDGRSLGPCSLNDPRAQTVRVLVQMTGGPVNFHMNEDRLGYVDRALGEERYALAIEAAHLFVAAPELLAAAEALVALDGDREKTEAALERLEAAAVKARGETGKSEPLKKPLWLLPEEPREGPHQHDTLSGVVYGLLLLEGGRLIQAGTVFERFIKAHLARVEADPEKIRWSWGNCGIVCLTAAQADTLMREAFADHPTVEYRGFVQ